MTGVRGSGIQDDMTTGGETTATVTEATPGAMSETVAATDFRIGTGVTTEMTETIGMTDGVVALIRTVDHHEKTVIANPE
jgi:hypothetical protein